MAIIINPGTESRPNATLVRAETIAARIATDFGWTVARDPKHDRPGHGYWGFLIAGVEVDLPGDDADEFFASRPFVSRRMYVNGSSWLWGYGAGFIEDAISKREDRR